MVTRAGELTSADRDAAIERYKMYLGIGYPPGGLAFISRACPRHTASQPVLIVELMASGRGGPDFAR
jgi:hypothetical protein